MSVKISDQKLERLLSQMWRHLERANWHSAAMLADYMTDPDAPRSGTGLAESTRALARISEAIRLNEPIDQDILVRLDEIALTWPRLYTMSSFQTLLHAVEEAVAKGHNTLDVQSVGLAVVPSQHLPPSSWRSMQGFLGRIVRPKGRAGVAATVACILAVLVVLNSIAYYYLREQPQSPDGPERGLAALTTLPSWHGLMDLEGPVDTIILGDSTARVDLVTGPFADRLGGDVINLANNAGSSLLMDAWMLQYYLDRFGAPRNVVLLRNCHGYEYVHNVEFMSAVPLEWGYWDRLGATPAWEDGDQWDLFVSKYGVLYSSSDILSDRLTRPLDLFAQPYKKRDASPYYSRGSVADSELDMFRRGNTDSTYSPFLPSSDSDNAVAAMSEQARSFGFQLYLVVGPEWDEAYQDPDRQAKVAGMVEWLSRFTDPQYVHVLLSTPLLYRADQMQNINHLRPGAEIQYTEAVVAEMVAVQNALASGQVQPLHLSSIALDKPWYAVGDQVSVTLSLTADRSPDAPALVEGEVSCLIRWGAMSDSKWVYRAPAATFSVAPGSSTKMVLVPEVGELPMAGGYDLVVFIRQDVGGLSYETRIEKPWMVKVS